MSTTPLIIIFVVFFLLFGGGGGTIGVDDGRSPASSYKQASSGGMAD